MKTKLSLVFALSVLALTAAEPKETVLTAAKTLADKPNYSWTSTPKSEGGGGQFRPGPTHGQTEKGGLTYLKMSFNDNDFETLIQGEKVALKMQDGWKGGEELTEAPGSFMARRFKTFRAPAQEIQDVITKTKGLKESDGVISGDLTEEGVKELLARGGRRGGQGGPEVSGAKGDVKVWVKDGALSKYEYHVQGKISGQNGDFDVNRTTTVEIKDVGSTKVNAPEEGKKKLS
jgi:hypothetical protein